MSSFNPSVWGGMMGMRRRPLMGQRRRGTRRHALFGGKRRTTRRVGRPSRYGGVRRRVRGRGFWGDIWSGLKKTGNFIKDSKILSGVASLIPHPAGAVAGRVLSTIGLGRRRRVYRRRRRVGLARRHVGMRRHRRRRRVYRRRRRVHRRRRRVHRRHRRVHRRRLGRGRTRMSYV